MKRGLRSPVCVALAALVVVVSCPWAGAQQAAPGAPAASQEPRKPPRPPRKDRVFPKDIEGVWMTRDYVEALRLTRSPLDAAKKAIPLVLKVQRDGPGYPVLRTDFHKASLLRLIDIEPGGKPGEFRLVLSQQDSGPISASDTTIVPMRGDKGMTGRLETLSVADPLFSRQKFREYIRLEGNLTEMVNEIVIAGTYADTAGREYSFDKAGEARMADATFAYEVQLGHKGLACNMIESPDDGTGAPRKRYGFAWKGEKLQLFEVTGTKLPFKCAPKPFAVLQPKGA